MHFPHLPHQIGEEFDLYHKTGGGEVEVELICPDATVQIQIAPQCNCFLAKMENLSGVFIYQSISYLVE